MPDDPFSLPRNPYDAKLPFGPPSQFGVTGPGQIPPQRLTPMQMPAAVSVTQQVSTIKKLEDSISAIDKMLSQGELRPERCAAVLMNIQSALAPIFGGKSKIVLSVGDWKKDLKPPFNSELFCSRVAQIRQFVSILKTCSDEPSLAPISVASRPPLTKSVFIIHGHDELNWRRLADALRTDLQLDPVVILARPGQSQTIIEKFESEASKCAYAIALFTPDDGVTNQSSGSVFQARPNVIFEAGWFLGRLGRSRTLLLVKEGTILHSDFAGVNQIRFDDDVTDKFRQIKQELEAAGMV